MSSASEMNFQRIIVSLQNWKWLHNPPSYFHSTFEMPKWKTGDWLIFLSEDRARGLSTGSNPHHLYSLRTVQYHDWACGETVWTHTTPGKRQNQQRFRMAGDSHWCHRPGVMLCHNYATPFCKMLDYTIPTLSDSCCGTSGSFKISPDTTVWNESTEISKKEDD